MALPCILVAATSLAMRAIEQALGTGVALMRAKTLDEALKLIAEAAPNLVIVGYHFEQGRALLHYLQEQFRSQKVPVILVRVLTLPLEQRSESDIRAAYKPLGVDEFVSLYDDQLRLGVKGAGERFRSVVFSRLSFSI
jgi:response regulator RpfG family c-di-GMP phosphodiesterase